MAFNIPTQTLGEIFQNQYPFEVPKYQRGYAWEQEELGDFIKDIATLQKVPSSLNFMGGIVHVHRAVASAVSRLHEVVDGQQRMGTFTLLVAAITHAMELLGTNAKKKTEKELCKAHKEELDEAYLFYKVMSGGKRVPTPKLTMSSVDKDFFSDIVAGQQSPASRATHKRIEQAYNKFKNELVNPVINDGSLTIKAKLKKLTDLAKLIANGFVVIHIVSHSRSEAYRLFSVLNDRGRNLSDGDLLRAKTLELTEPDPAIQARIERKWDCILDGSEEAIEKFLRAYYPSTLGKRAPKSGLYDAYEVGYLQEKKINDVEQFVSDLESEKRIFDDINKGIWPFPEASSVASAWDRDRLHRLVNILRHEAAHPLLMSSVKLGEKKFIEILYFLERFVFRYVNIIGAHPSPIYAPYYAESVAIRSTPKTYSPDSLRKKLRDLLRARAPDDLFSDALVLRMQYSDDSARNRLIRHLLTTLESYHASADRGDKGKKLKPATMHVFDLASTTLEHIHPQNPALPDAVLDPLVNTLGNLAVLAGTDNSAAGNDSFAKKKKNFASSGVSLNHEISALASWDKAELDGRQSRLVELALIVFDI